jgi:serine phosphatase RsbU (regulator of sigma subunit)/anti-sigma regulatory factor (Ser/Thr protein kinase)
MTRDRRPRNVLVTVMAYNEERRMSVLTQSITRVIRRGGRSRTAAGEAGDVAAVRALAAPDSRPIEIGPNDPILGFLQSAAGVVDVEGLELLSPAVEALREAGVKLVVPLVSQGELIGIVSLGPRLSDQAYSSDDRKLLLSLAAQAAPALQVAQLVRRQEAEARSRERIEQELRVATLIQQNFLPKTLPDLPGWHVSAYYRPAREVGGDFYDFIDLPGGRVGVVIGDVTDKGVPAAMVMAATRSVLRASAQRMVSPGAVLQRVNELMCPDMPPKMFVTCLYGVIDPATGRFRFANAGHNLPYVRTSTGTIELRATGMPLGLLPGIEYEETETFLEPDQTMLLHSDGVAEAHSEAGEMFGFPRLLDVVGSRTGRGDVIDRVLTELGRFTPADREQEDDITLVALRRAATASGHELRPVEASFEVASERGNERLVMDRVAQAVAPLALPAKRLERLKTAVSEAAMNAIEHGNDSDPSLSVAVRVRSDAGRVTVSITDHGGHELGTAETPDLEAKLEGRQKARGWGLFLIQNMVDEVHESNDGGGHTIELVLETGGGDDDGD